MTNRRFAAAARAGGAIAYALAASACVSSTTPTPPQTSAASDARYTGGSGFERVATYFVERSAPQDAENSVRDIAFSVDGMRLVYADEDGRRSGVQAVSTADVSALVDTDFANVGGGQPFSGGPVLVETTTSYTISAGVGAVAPFAFVAFTDATNKTIIDRIAIDTPPTAMAVSPDERFLALVINEQQSVFNGSENIDQFKPSLLVLDLAAGPAAGWAPRALSLADAAVAPRDRRDDGRRAAATDVAVNADNLAAISLRNENTIVTVDLEARALSIKDAFSAGEATLDQTDTNDNRLIELAYSSLVDQPRRPDALAWLSADRLAAANFASRGFSVFSADGAVIFDTGDTLDHELVRSGHFVDGARFASKPEFIEVATINQTPMLFLGLEDSAAVAVYAFETVPGSPPVLGARSPVYKGIIPTGVEPKDIAVAAGRGLIAIVSYVNDNQSNRRSMISLYSHTGSTTYPSIISEDAQRCIEDAGTPIFWGGFSALAGRDRVYLERPDTIVAVHDDTFRRVRTVLIDVSAKPARITSETYLFSGETDTPASLFPQLEDYRDDCTVDNTPGAVVIEPIYSFSPDLQGISIYKNFSTSGRSHAFNPMPAGAGIGATDPMVSIDSASQDFFEGRTSTPPQYLLDRNDSLRFAGVATPPIDANTTPYTYVIFREPLDGEPKDRVRIARFLSDYAGGGDWAFAWYPFSIAPQGGADIVIGDMEHIEGDRFAVIERDAAGGPDARVKLITEFSIAGVTFKPVDQPGAFETVPTKIVRDLLKSGDLETASGLTPQSLDGLAITADGDAWVVNNNRNGKGRTPETTLFRLPGLFK